MSSELTLRKGRTSAFNIGLFESDGTTEVLLVAGDKVRIKLGRAGLLPVLDMDSIAPLAGGSSVTFTVATNDVVLTLDQDDTDDLFEGVYGLEINVVDSADNNRIKHADTGILHLLPAQLGDIGTS